MRMNQHNKDTGRAEDDEQQSDAVCKEEVRPDVPPIPEMPRVCMQRIKVQRISDGSGGSGVMYVGRV
ncbi:hypothetical protein EYF80_041412 [Liparis tanakae]|uniref:Uncharacterized protein n=1 Tax=Liparis tanakae TaxID=230148 RepID=A0A4Z2G6G4_9TELE|nr:hypothetical protein EYF80_041412 [Liparis tanakae]